MSPLIAVMIVSGAVANICCLYTSHRAWVKDYYLTAVLSAVFGTAAVMQTGFHIARMIYGS